MIMHRSAHHLIIAMGLLSALQTASAKQYVYVLTGQSNSLGAVKGSPATPEQLERYKSHARLWNGNMVRDTGVRFEKSPAWQEVRPQLPRYGSLCMGPEYGFAYMMQKRGWHTGNGDSLCIIKASLDGGGNSFWLPEGKAWKSLTGSLHSALSALEGETKVQALLYLQGESDKGDEITHASERFLSLHARLGKEVKKGLKLAVVGECATWKGRDNKDAKGSTTAESMHAMTRTNKNVGWVRTRDLTKITVGDNMGVHYDGKSQITIGARYAYAVAALEKEHIPSVRSDAAEAALDQPSAWWNGKRPGPKDVIIWDVAAANCADALGSGLSVGGLVVEDPFRGRVTISSDNKRPGRLKLGADGVKLKGGNLELHCAVETAADQVWEVAAGRKLALGSKAAPVSLSGSGCITLKAPQNAEVELHLTEAPPQHWKLSTPLPHVHIFIGGRKADFKAVSEAVYKIAL